MDLTGLEFCDECGQPCHSALALRKHKYMHKNSAKYKENRAKRSNRQDGEEITTTTIEVYPCNRCGKVFKSKTGIEQHIKVSGIGDVFKLEIQTFQAKLEVKIKLFLGGASKFLLDPE